MQNAHACKRHKCTIPVRIYIYSYSRIRIEYEQSAVNRYNLQVSLNLLIPVNDAAAKERREKHRERARCWLLANEEWAWDTFRKVRTRADFELFMSLSARGLTRRVCGERKGQWAREESALGLSSHSSPRNSPARVSSAAQSDLSSPLQSRRVAEHSLSTA